MSLVRSCIILPVYQHAEPLRAVLRALMPLGLPCIVVDDANATPVQDAIAADSSIEILRLPMHGGKGAACIAGSQRAVERGFTHAIFMDADGQHHPGDVPRVLMLMQTHPEAMILGQPVFDQSAPFSRRVGRWVSNVWVWIETCSLEIGDSLCGFRGLPLDKVLQVARATPLGRRMDFDPDLLVRLFWAGVPVRTFETPVRYIPGGISNFKLGRDNVALCWLHTRLFFGMIPRLPFLLARRWKTS